MKTATFKILFVTKKSRMAKNGEVPIILRITINSQRVETTVNLKVALSDWNVVACKSMGSSRADNELNDRLDTIRLRVMQIYRQMEIDGKAITAKAILDEYQGKNTKEVVTLCELFEEHNERCHQLIGKGMSKATAERYDTCLRHIKQFMHHSFGQEDIPIADVNHKFIKDYEFWYKTEKSCSHNTTTKYLKNFKKIIRIALANEIITRDPFANIKFHLEDVERDFLEDHELQAIINKKFTIDRLAQVRDIFVFCCFSGLAFSDVKQLTREHISRDNNGALWIRKRRQKTNNMCNIPLLDIAQGILERYKDHPACRNGALLPVQSNQKFNAYLKEIADLCAIKKLISSHTARHSYATSVCLANGVSMENVAKMLGHSDTKMTRHYAKVLDKSIKRDMDIVNEKLSMAYAK